MLRGGPQASDTQKQKKRLSFKDPEIEGPQKTFYGGCRPKGSLIERRKEGASVENLALEDQAFQIAHNVGSAFSDLSLQEPNTLDYFDTALDTTAENEDSKAEALINDCFLSDPSYQRSCQQQNFRISAEDQEFLDDLSPPLQVPNMRCPSIENSMDPYHRNSIPAEVDKYPSSAQHQIQLLKYQLDQQNQQTQLALHQIQLLTDQVGAENAARKKAQEQNNQLMMQNQELLNHIERLFQQIEELEKQIHFLERSSKIPHLQETQPSQQRMCPTYPGNRRLSGDSALDRPTQQSNYLTPRRSSFATNKQNNPPQQKHTTNPPQPKMAMSPPQPNPQTHPHNPQTRRTVPLTSPKPQPPIQNRPTYAKTKDTLHIGDSTPPVQNETASPFSSSNWKLKTEPEPDKAGRTRTGSFSSFSKLKPPENIKSSLMSCNTGAPSITNKKYSSSTSDLYNTSGTYQASKPLVLEDSSAGAKSAISNVNVNASTSKLPRFQPYTGSGRRSSLTKDFEQFSMMGKDKYKTAPQTSFYNR